MQSTSNVEDEGISTSMQAGTPDISTMSEEQLAAMLDEYLKSPDDDTLLKIYDAYISTGSYDDNMTTFGVVSLDAPSSISIYTDSFENKEAISVTQSKYPPELLRTSITNESIPSSSNVSNARSNC